MGNAQTNWDVGYERESKVQVCAQPVQYSQQSREQAMWEDLREGVVCACAHVCVNTCRCGGRCQVLRKWPRFCFFLKSFQGPHQSSRIACALVGELQKCYTDMLH